MRRLAGLLTLAACCGCEPFADAPTTQTSIPEEGSAAHIAARYKSFQLMTPQPHPVDDWIAAQCRDVTRQQVDFAREQISGPHAYSRVRIFMNESAAEAFEADAELFPVGSIIVKEKEPLPYVATSPSREWINPPAGVGGMIKRPAGYDAAHGDWEYFYFENIDQIQTGRLQSCIDCHSAGRATDHVFGYWKQPSTSRTTK